MASSKVMASRSPPNTDRPHHHQPSPSAINLHSDHRTRGLGSMNMDDLFRNIYPDSDSFALDSNGAGAEEAGGGGGNGGRSRSSGPEVGGEGLRTRNGAADEVWRDIVSVGSGGGAAEPAMTLEDFLAKAGAVTEEDVRVPAVVAMPPPPPPPPTSGAFGMETVMMNPTPVPFAPAIRVQNGYGVEFRNGLAAAASGSNSAPVRVKRRPTVTVEDAPLDKASQQKQRRMIKNRESAARSRERKQAYTVELETLVTQLEEENARLAKEEAELKKERREQLMKRIIPIVEKQRPRKRLGRSWSMEW
ncbi:bZIP transcription factor 12-like [Andrographis paniculata]|uniref:bZIP transcription factor 12-like n=1 Tax=Andrographis paniculata TaxID=175694 RepID=UPI0021E900AD|nr:bZIP transcription factor 12-like [Andrographis paniculata]